ncbi:MAG: hypothetical protein F2601_02775 [Actinobacteria bacterium]|uniref:Unannotated protein n=1 Tax=freshwater metagenome TaxID=449393 RepID=A0A6J6I7R1_9ZZZZ|nr:hypothetical protein [Actinomycetota bacterium]
MALTDCVTYPLVLAAEDIVPIVLAGVGYWYLSKRVLNDFDGSPAVALAMRIAAVLLVVCSFLAGPVRKILANVAAVPICAPDFEVPYSQFQIPFVSALAPGFAILSWGVICTLKGRKVAFWPAIVLLALGVVGAVAVGERTILFAVGGLWATALAVSTGILAARQRDFVATGLFALYALGTLALPPISSKGNVSDVNVQWLAQGINTATQGLFLYACYRLFTRYQRQSTTTAV